MAIHVKCPNAACQKTLQCPVEHAGKAVKCPACGAQIQIPSTVGGQTQVQMLGDYQLVGKLGEGGMGTVYEAIQVKLKRQVALKVLPQESTKDETFLARFHREAQAAASLNHPNIVQVYDIAEDKGHHFFAMEYVDGEDVNDRLKREGRLPLEDALRVVEGVARGLNYAHKHGIIHRDIKPDNIMVDREGHVKLADLGLAKRVEDDSTVTRTGAGMGTPYYMAPEQAEDARSVDHRADIYALGVTWLHILTGRRPFDGDSAYGIIIQHREKGLPSAQELGAEIPQGVEAVIRKMAAKEPEKRYQDYDSLLADLEKISSGQAPEAVADRMRELPTIATTSGSRTSRLRARQEKGKGKGALVAGIVVIGLVLVGAGVFLATRSGKEPEPTKQATTTKPLAGLTEESPSQDADAAEALSEAEDYARENPNNFDAIITKFEQVREMAQGTSHARKAAGHVRAWRGKWEAAAESEFTRRLQSAEEQLVAGRIGEALGVWRSFPANLKTATIGHKIGEQSARIAELLKGMVKEMEEEAEGLLAREPAELVQDDLQALKALKAKAGDAPEGLPAQVQEALTNLMGEIDAGLASHQEALAAKQAEAFGAFWAQYEGLMKARKFEPAGTLVADSGEVLDEKDQKRLAGDTQTVKGLLARAGSSLPELKGKVVRVGGIGMTVSDVKDGKVYVEQGGAQIAFGLERLDSETLLSMALAGEKDPKALAGPRALFTFYYGKTSDAVKALKEAADLGVDVSFYQARLTPVLVISTVPAGAEVVLFRKRGDGNWDKLNTKPLRTPLRTEAEKNTTYRVEIAKSLYRLETREVTTGEGGDYRLTLRLKKGGLPAAMRAAFEIPTGSKDRHGNPIRKGYDRGNALPLEIWHRTSGMHLVYIPPGDFLMGSPNNARPIYGTEFPQHRVRFASPFYLGKYPVTQAECEAMIGSPCGRNRGASNPVDLIHGQQLDALLNKLNESTGTGDRPPAFSLPSEAQWEYACRAGTTAHLYYGDVLDEAQLSEFAWFAGNSGRTTHPVGQKKPNAWGLYDTLGNVFERCLDDWHPNYQGAPTDGSAWLPDGAPASFVSKSGYFGLPAAGCRPASRFDYGANVRPLAGGVLGLRVAVSVPGGSVPVTKEEPAPAAPVEEKPKRGKPRPGLVGLTSVGGKQVPIIWVYGHGKVLHHADIASAFTKHLREMPKSGIRIEFQGCLYLKRNSKVRVWHAGGSSNGGVDTLSIDGQPVSKIGDDTKKSHQFEQGLGRGKHKINWVLVGGHFATNLLKFEDLKTGDLLPVYFSQEDLEGLEDFRKKEIYEVESEKRGWPIPAGW